MIRHNTLSDFPPFEAGAMQTGQYLTATFTVS